MKKLFLLLSIGSIGLAANAQVMRHNSAAKPNLRKMVDLSGPVTPSTAPHAAHKGTSVAFYTQTFAGGLPGSWSTGSFGGGTWHYTTVASTSAYHLAALASTTAANGWMIFDSDSLGAACSCAPGGYLQSEAINCSSHPTVRLDFQELYRSFYDSTVIWVSTSPTFATYTRYPIGVNSSLATNSSTANPQTVHVNITSAAAGMANVYVRFVYYGYGGGSYSWNIDDVALAELDPHDISISKSFAWEPVGVYGSSIFNTPLNYVDSIYPVTQLSNLGANPEAAIPVTATIYQGSTSVYSHTMNYTIPVNGEDSLLQFAPGYLPNAVGSYTMPFSATLAGDADITNNVDTVKFNVTDTIWSVYSGNLSGSYYLYRSASSGTPLSYMQGARFDVPMNSAPDTVTGFSVAFSSESVPTNSGGKVSVMLYSLKSGDAGWTYQGSSVARGLTTADYSTASAVNWAYFPIDMVGSGGITHFILDTNTSYAAVIQVNGLSTDLLVLATVGPNATGFAGYFGQGDSSQNTGDFNDFGSTVATGLTSVPLIRMHFGNAAKLGVSNVNQGVIAAVAVPNPASSEVKINFTQVNAADVVVNLTNTVGQVVATKSVKGVTNGSATFNTAALPAGVYFYTVNANGARSTGRLVVAH